MGNEMRNKTKCNNHKAKVRIERKQKIRNLNEGNFHCSRTEEEAAPFGRPPTKDNRKF